MQAICAGHVSAMHAAAAAVAAAAGMESTNLAAQLELAEDMLLAAVVHPELGLDASQLAALEQLYSRMPEVRCVSCSWPRSEVGTMLASWLGVVMHLANVRHCMVAG